MSSRQYRPISADGQVVLLARECKLLKWKTKEMTQIEASEEEKTNALK